MNFLIKNLKSMEINKEIKDLESYHQGRHACRDKYKKSNLLVINPHIDIDSLIKSPCENCKEYNSQLKAMCGKATTCKAKQEQLTAIEIKQHFKTLKEYEDATKAGCLACEHFALWDGDYCCIKQMKVLSSCSPELAAVSPLKVIGFNAAQNCETYREADDYAVKRNKEMWNTFNKYQKVV